MSQHILLYTDEPGIGGIAQRNYAMLRGLCSDGYRVTLVQTRAETPLIAEQQAWGVHHHWLSFDTMKDFGQSLTCVEESTNIFKQFQPDLILFSDGCPVSNFAAKQVALQLDIPYLMVIGFAEPEMADTFDFCLPALKQQFACAKAVVLVSHENLFLLHQHFGLDANQGQVILNGRPDRYFAPPDLTVRDRLRQSLGIPNDAIVCFTAARLEGIKGYQFQLDAIAHLRHTLVWQKLYFVWAGEGELRSFLETAIAELEVGDRVKLLGQRWDMPDWFDAADIFVLPTYREGMPLSVMEAMAKGLPVVASAVSGVPEEMGETGQLLPDPNQNPQATLEVLIQTLTLWTQPDLRQALGQAAQQRAEGLFREERMIQETLQLVKRSLLPPNDYVSDGLAIVTPDAAFPNKVMADPQLSPWVYLRREVPHNWYVDRREPNVGFLSRDEAHILYNTALQFKGKRALEIGCWMGWSACHLAMAGVDLDVVDPLLEDAGVYQTVDASLKAAGVRDRVNLIAGYSPEAVEAFAVKAFAAEVSKAEVSKAEAGAAEAFAVEQARRWSLIFIDGNHDTPGPLQDAIACEQWAESDALILFHDLASPDVAEGLDYLKQRGWQTMIYQTMQIMGVAWRGKAQPIAHIPDPAVSWDLPHHLRHYEVSGMPQPVTDPMLRLLVEVEQLQLPAPQSIAPIALSLSDRQQLKIWHQAAKQSHIKGDRQTAQTIYTQILQVNPGSAIAHAYLSTSFWQEGNLRQSLRQSLWHHAQAHSAHLLERQENSEFQTLLATVRPYTLLSDERLFSLYAIAKQICLDDIPGNFVECGTCRGGAAALLAAVIQQYSLRDRQLYAFDTFEGMPEPTDADRHDGVAANDTGFGAGTLKAPVAEYLEKVCQTLGVSDLVVPIAGLFAHTLPQYKAEMGDIALLHADGDWYESTLDIFNTLYDRVVPEGFIQIDDYGHWEGCRQAVHEFERSHNTALVLQTIDYTGVWCRKQDPAAPHWRSLWHFAEMAAHLGNAALAERSVRAVLKLLPGLVQAEAKLANYNLASRQIHLPEFLRDEVTSPDFQDWLGQTLRLRSTNLVIFPDWNQAEENLFAELVELFRELMNHVDRQKITLLVYPGTLDPLDADMAVSSIVMHLLSEDNSSKDNPEVSEDDLAISLLNDLDTQQWQTLRDRLTARVALVCEDKEAIAHTGTASLNVWAPSV